MKEKKIPFNVPCFTGGETGYIRQAVRGGKLAGDGPFTKKCHEWMERRFHCPKVLLTTSCTHALEMAALLAGIKAGDEVIMPSYTFVSTANAFVLRGATAVFTDIRPDTMNLDERLVEQAMTGRTRAIVAVHYAGVSCEMDALLSLARKYKVALIEDAAQGVLSLYKGKPLGTIGDIGCFSFHETKNYTCGEGGAALINRKKLVERSEIIREKGTNRLKYFRGEVDKYTWVDVGSSYLPGELNAAYLLAQLESADRIMRDRLQSWHAYEDGLSSLARSGHISLPVVPSHCTHNGHMFYIKTKNLPERTSLIEYLKKNNVYAAFHYVPLHRSLAGRRFGRFAGRDRWTTRESERLLRLPLFYGIKSEEVQRVIKLIRKFYHA